VTVRRGPNESGQEPAKGLDNTPRDLGPNALDGADDILTFRHRSLGERYAKDRVVAHLHFLGGIKRDGDISQYYCATFQRTLKDLDAVGVKVRPAANVSTRNDPWSAEIDTDSTSRKKWEVHKAVLVVIGEAVQESQHRRRIRVPSTVRLQVLDDCLSGGIDLPYTAFDFVSVGLAQDRETDVIGNLLRKRHAEGGLSESERQMVQDVPEVLETVAQEKSDPNGRFLTYEHALTMLTGLGIEFIDQYYGITTDPSVDLVIESFQMFICPDQLPVMATRAGRPAMSTRDEGLSLGLHESRVQHDYAGTDVERRHGAEPRTDAGDADGRDDPGPDSGTGAP
jgi:hypothetical protein